MIPENIRTDFEDANWKLRLAALEEMTTWLEGGVVESVESELVVRFLAKKGWGEKNFQVSHRHEQVNTTLIYISGVRSRQNCTESCLFWQSGLLLLAKPPQRCVFHT